MCVFNCNYSFIDVSITFQGIVLTNIINKENSWWYSMNFYDLVLNDCGVQLVPRSVWTRSPGIIHLVSDAQLYMLQAWLRVLTWTRHGNGWILGDIDGCDIALQDGFGWNGLDGGSMWKSYIIWMPPPHIMAHPSTESWLPYQRTVDLHRWPQHDDLGLRHDARVALCPWGRREPMPGSFLVWDDDELTKFKWGIMGTNWICDSLSCTL